MYNVYIKTLRVFIRKHVRYIIIIAVGYMFGLALDFLSIHVIDSSLITEFLRYICNYFVGFVIFCVCIVVLRTTS